MVEYIEREALLELYDMGKEFEEYAQVLSVPISVIMQNIKDMPAADVAPVVHGRWIKPTKIGHRAFNIPHCSACDGVPCGVDENTSYCPNCGAKMDM